MRERLDDRIHRLRRVEHRRAAVLQSDAPAASLGGTGATAGSVARPGGHLRREAKAIGRRRSRRRERIAALIADGVVAALSSQSERLVEALDVKTMVVDKLDELDMAEIERIILQVVDKELNWITILGGILGGIIGVFQSLLSLL